MATIDDILNASDSDDEEINGVKQRVYGINLESLLEDDDDDDDDDDEEEEGEVGNAGVVLLPAQMSGTGAGAGADESSVPKVSSTEMNDGLESNAEIQRLRSFYDAPLDMKAFSGHSSTMESRRTSVDKERENDVDGGSIGIHSSQSDVVDYLSSLEMAEVREQKNTSGTSSRDLNSALQMKRSNVTSSVAETSSSSIKHSELDVLSTQLRRNASYKQHGPGIATAIHVHKRFFVIGTSSGLLLLFDRNQEIRQVIGSSSPQGTRCYKAVTAIDALPSGAVIICGYLSGEICLWDVAKGTTLKRVTDIHNCRISRLQFISNLSDTNVSLPSTTATAIAIPSDFTIVSVDAKGIVNRGRFTKSLWATFGSDFDLLLDGQSGIVLDMATLSLRQYEECGDKSACMGSSSGNDAGSGVKIGKDKDMPVASPIISNMNFVAFNSLTRTYVVQILPDVRVIHRWAAPSFSGTVKASSPSSPNIPASSLDWAWTIKRHYRWPILARSWGDCVQVMCLDCGAGEVAAPTLESRFVFTVMAEQTIPTTCGGGILSVKWIDSERLIMLSANQIFVANAQLEVLETAPLPSNLSSSIVASFEIRNPEDSVPASLHVSGSCLFVLSPDSLMQLQFQSWTQQVDQMIRDGKWLEALATVLESCGFWSLVDGSAAHLRVRSDEFFESRNMVIAEIYIRKYVELAVSQQALNSTSSNFGVPGSMSSNSTIKSHFHLVSGVCIEYCMASKRLTLLFGEIFDSFVRVGQEGVFLEALAPYILNRSIRNLPPHMLNKMIEAENDSPAFSCLERCVVHLDLEQTDFERLSKVLLDKRMYSGFVYVYSYGCKDAVKAFKLLFAKMTSISRERQLEVSPGRRASASIQIPLPTPEEAEIGYKMLLYLKFLANGKIFPRGERTVVSSESVSGLLALILSEGFQYGVSKQELTGEWQKCRFPYLSYLVLIDAGATMFCISKALHFLEEQNAEVQLLLAMYKQLFEFTLMVDAAESTETLAFIERNFFDDFAMESSDGSNGERIPLVLNSTSLLHRVSHPLTHSPPTPASPTPPHLYPPSALDSSTSYQDAWLRTVDDNLRRD